MKSRPNQSPIFRAQDSNTLGIMTCSNGDRYLFSQDHSGDIQPTYFHFDTQTWTSLNVMLVANATGRYNRTRRASPFHLILFADVRSYHPTTINIGNKPIFEQVLQHYMRDDNILNVTRLDVQTYSMWFDPTIAQQNFNGIFGFTAEISSNIGSHNLSVAALSTNSDTFKTMIIYELPSLGACLKDRNHDSRGTVTQGTRLPSDNRLWSWKNLTALGDIWDCPELTSLPEKLYFMAKSQWGLSQELLEA